jgi:Domain of unknown function (DUF6265)
MLPTAPIRAPLDAFEWLSGRWTGESGTDRFEEAWSAPQHGTMLGMFRLFRAGAARFYELLALATEGDGLAFRFRHFDPDMVGWEERAEPLVFDLVQLDDERALFAERHRTRWMTYRREGDDRLVVSFATESGPSADEFHFVRG